MENAAKNVTSDESKKGPGRPAKHGVPMTAAERQRAYRLRVRKGVLVAIENPSLASRPELMRELVNCLAYLERDFDDPHHRYGAEKCIRALVTRYDLKL